MSEDISKIRNVHPDFPELSRLVQIGRDSRRGRFIEAIEDIPCGTVICNEEGITVGIDPAKCAYCLKDCPSKEKCQTYGKSILKYLKLEELVKEELSNLGMVGLTIRVILSHHQSVWEQQFLKNIHPPHCPVSNIFHLQKSTELDDFTPIMGFLNKFKNILEVNSDWNKASKNFFFFLFQEIFSRLKVNAHVIYHLGSEEDVPAGTGLFPISSIFNHSCRANVFSFFHHNHFIWVSLGIKKGEEVVDNYGVQAHSTIFEDRKEFLLGRGFTCICSECQKGPQDELLTLPNDFQLPSNLSYQEIRRLPLPHDHIVIYQLLESNLFEGSDEAIECFEWMKSNQKGRGVVFEPAMVDHLLALLKKYKNSDKYSNKLLDWKLATLTLMRLYYKNLHPRFLEVY